MSDVIEAKTVILADASQFHPAKIGDRKPTMAVGVKELMSYRSR